MRTYRRGEAARWTDCLPRGRRREAERHGSPRPSRGATEI